ncbi:rhodanese-like domain-containing protein [Frigidibacter sp. ROC022]|uniref:rhodanese-like domain-containing protein n=1 Tax=Frigidibacter sp. ROC022 TaxID=2971796 RepID=UPI00215B323C|nr:rhodanese-like domain-containing protein [Frigidibacter sp. ROC022]MCR8723563.1 rhodanese-like domain-containing protein [Frigidibacter sp. ROC022]
MFAFLRKSRSDMSPAEAVALAREGRIVLIDVRGPDEIAISGKAEGALCIPLGEIGLRCDPKSAGFDERLACGHPVAVYCATGMRSGRAVEVLRNLGHENVHNIGGLGDWLRAGGKRD